MTRTSTSADLRPTGTPALERRKLKKIAVEKQRRARMNRALTALRGLLEQEDGQLDDADTAQVLDMAVHVMRSCQRHNEAPAPHPTRPATRDDVRDGTSYTKMAPPVTNMAAGQALLSDLDLQRLVDYQAQLDSAVVWQRAGHLMEGHLMEGQFMEGALGGVGRYPEGLVLRHLEQAVRAGPGCVHPATVWRPW